MKIKAEVTRFLRINLFFVALADLHTPLVEFPACGRCRTLGSHQKHRLKHVTALRTLVPFCGLRFHRFVGECLLFCHK